MSRSSLFDADGVYACAGGWELRRHPVWHPEFRRFCLELGSLDRALGEHREDEYWGAFLRPLKRYRFELTAAPLPFNYQKEESFRIADQLKGHLAQCGRLYPSFSDSANNLVNRFLLVAKLEENPYLKVSEDLFARDSYHVAAVVLAPRLIPAAQAILASSELLKDVVILSPTQLRENASYRQLAVFGPVSWYPEYVLGAPRAKKVHVISFGWVQDPWKPRSLFVGSDEGGTERRERAHVVPDLQSLRPVESRNPDDVLLPSEVLPQISWDRLTREHSRNIPGEHSQEQVEARMFLLEGGHAVFLDVDENSSSLIIDLEEEDDNRVKRAPVGEIEPGMFLLLRTGGGGDFIVPVADKILGDQSVRAREMQVHWKKRLRDLCEWKTMEEAAGELRTLGAEKANPANLRRWMSYRSIKTNDPADFAAIMKFVGLEQEADEYWAMMEHIAGAHHKAGSYIRRLLLKEVREADLTSLRKLGRMEFELSEADSGSMTAFRVTDISPRVTPVPAGRINHLLEI